MILEWIPRVRPERAGLGNSGPMDEVRRNMISRGLSEEDAKDRELWKSKITLE